MAIETLSDNVKIVCKALKPIYDALKKEVLGSTIIKKASKKKYPSPTW